MATHWRSEGDIWSDLLRYATRSNAPAANAVFASITVTTTADTIDAAANCPSVTLASLPGPDGQTSLREAICAANSNAGPDTITFSVNGTFALTGAVNEDNGSTGDFDIKQSLTINGNGTANTILDGSGIERIFDVFPSAASTFNLSNLTIQNGDTRSTSFKEGGAMYLHNNVTATLNSIQVINNFSGANGAIETRGSLTINNSVISNNQTLPASGNEFGGGIHNAGTLTIDNTTISNNTVRGEGGGLAIATAAGVTVTITDSTISSNTASVTGGGNGNGGGISTTGNQGTINITNSTISGNRADANGGGAAFVSVNANAVNLTNVTITNNTADNDNNGSGAGGGFSQGTTTVTLRNTIVAGNFNSTAATRDDISGAVVNTSSYNLIGDGTGMSGISNGVNNNQVGSGASPINPLLSALSNNGGSTQTHALLSGSPAIDAGSTALAPATDQRGVTRPGGSAADIGAYEVGDTVPPDTTITGNPTNPSNSSSATFTFIGSDNVTPAGSLTFQCQIDGGGFSACTSPRNYTALADGSHTFQVRSIDAAGNTDPTPANYTWIVDATPPNTTITANPTNPSASTTASFSFTGNDGSGTGVASFQCQLDGGGFSTCTSPRSYMGLADGSHTFQVRAVDVVGNADPTPASYTWTVDTVAPMVQQLVRGNASPTSASSVTFSLLFSESVTNSVAGNFTLVPGGAVTGAMITNVSCNMAAHSCVITVNTGSGSGTLGLNMTSSTGVTDSGGSGISNLPFIGEVYTIDKVAPDTTITANPPNPSASANASFSFTGSDPGGSGVASFQCQLDGGGFSACTSPQNYTGLADGSHTFQVRAVDAVGNVDGTPASYTWTIDTTPPPAPVVITPANSSSTNNTQPLVSGTTEPGSTVTVFLDATAVGTANADASGNWMFTPPVPLSDGSHTTRARAADAVGNTSPNSNTNTFIVDTVAPNTTITTNPTNPSASANASFSFTGSDPGGSGVASFQCQLDGGGFSACTSPQNYTGLADGSHTFQVRAVDGAGNTDNTPASFTWIVDTTRPDTTITANPPNPSASANASFSFTGSDPGGSGVASFQCQLDGGGFSACTSPQNYTGLADGSHTFQVRAVDTAGNADSTPASYTWVIDTVAPDTTITANPTNPSNSANASFSFTGSDLGGSGVASFQCQLDGGGFNPCTSPQNFAGLADGSHTFQVRAIDAAGNTDSTPASFTWTIDTTPPDTTITANPPNPSSSTSANFSFIGNDGTGSGVASFQCQLDGGGFSACTSPQNYMGLSQGSHTFQVRAIDNLGHIDPTPASYTWSTNSLPTIMAVATSRTEGSPVANSQIATVNDVEDAEDQLGVTVNGGASAMSGGITINNIVVSSTGIVTANIVAGCGAMTTDFTLRVTDTAGGFTETMLKVTVDLNTPPTLTYAAALAASLGQTLMVNAVTGPADNGPNVMLAVESISAGFTGTASVASNGRVTINNAGPLGTHTFTIKATDNCGAVTQTSFMVTVFPFIAQLSDPLICTDNGSTMAVHAEVTNPNAVPANLNFSATIPAPMSGVANTCVSSAGTCTLTANNVTVTGLIAPNQTVTIDYKVAVANGTPQGTQLCIDSTASFNGGPVAMIQACSQLNCPAGGVVQANAQKTGSVLVFPYYNSQAANQIDTRLTISNAGNVTANVHLFFIAGASCEAANMYLCLTPKASFSFKASEYDPETTGWLLAVAVDDQGRPIRNNVLVGNGFVREGSYVGNYGAESFAARSGAVAAFPGNNTATLFFDGSSYDAVPDQFAVELQSPQEVPGQRLVTVGLRGDLTGGQMSGAGQVGTGLLINGNESPMSSFVSFLNGNCQALAILTGSTPRVAGGMSTLIPPGQVGTMRWQIGAGVGLLMTPRGVSGWSGIRNLHKTRATTSTITIPIFPPVC